MSSAGDVALISGPLLESLDQALYEVIDFLPRLLAAIAVLLVGLLVVRLLGKLTVRLLIAAGVDRLAQRMGVHHGLARIGLERSLARLLGALLRIVLLIVVVFAALTVSGLAFLSQLANEAILFLPKLVAAIGLALIGLALGGIARRRVRRAAYQMDLRGPLGSIVYGAIVGIALIMALGQLGIPTVILTVLSSVALAAVSLAFALALGLGSREVARELSAGRYVTGAYKVGQEVALEGFRGEILAIEVACCVLETDDGRRVRVPHHLFVERVVEVTRSTDGPSDVPDPPTA